MTTAERQLSILSREVRELKARLDRLMPLDAAVKPSFLKRIDRARKSGARYTLKNGSLSKAK